jgi:CxxC motif-containing protein (DUF1111 family)
MVSRGLIAALLSAACASSPCAAGSLDAEMGKALFNRQWVAAPSSTQSDDGLGPIYDARSCSACHAGGGQGSFVPKPVIGAGIVVRLGNANGAPDPVYGFQLQTKALPGQLPEAAPQLIWRQDKGYRVPALTLGRLNFGPLARDTHAASRRAPSLYGIGLLAGVSDKEILLHAIEEKNYYGLSPRPAWQTDAHGQRRLGRFGWKAIQPDLTGQVGSALSRDIGLSTTAYPDPWGECSATEKVCRAGPHGAKLGAVEVPDTLRNLIVDYLNALPPPQPRPDTMGGRAVFVNIGCAACHAMLHNANGQRIDAFTDLLLHDLGPGLNDGLGEGAAKPGEWRTAPLWGLSERLAKGGLLHDGRARSVAEAVHWHGGDGALAHARFDALTKDERAALLSFLEGL